MRSRVEVINNIDIIHVCSWKRLVYINFYVRCRLISSVDLAEHDLIINIDPWNSFKGAIYYTNNSSVGVYHFSQLPFSGIGLPFSLNIRFSSENSGEDSTNRGD